MNDARTVYPVIIDPTVTVSRAQSNIHDTFVTQSSPNANYGSYDYLRFGYNGGKIFSYVRFVNLGILWEQQ